MKRRTSFVTNSSSSSFIVNIDALTGREVDVIMSYVNDEDNGESWYITKDDQNIEGYTVMDNDYFWEYLRQHNVNLSSFSRRG